MRIGIDLDDVLVDFISTFTGVASDMYGIDRNIRPIDWEWSNYGLDKDQKSAVWEKVKGTYNFWETLGVEEGASLYSMRKLVSRSDVDLIFITARKPTLGRSVQSQSARWLDHKFGLFYPTVIVDSNKGPIAAALKLDYFVDDRPKNCLEIMSAVPNCKVFLKNSTHNASYVSPKELPRVQNFNEFVNEVLSA